MAKCRHLRVSVNTSPHTLVRRLSPNCPRTAVALALLPSATPRSVASQALVFPRLADSCQRWFADSRTFESRWGHHSHPECRPPSRAWTCPRETALGAAMRHARERPRLAPALRPPLAESHAPPRCVAPAIAAVPLNVATASGRTRPTVGIACDAAPVPSSQRAQRTAREFPAARRLARERARRTRPPPQPSVAPGGPP